MNLRLLERVLRALAIAIVLAALVDPEIVTSRRVEPLVALVYGPASSSQAIRTEERLQGRYDVVRGALPGADVSVVFEDANAAQVDMGRPVVVIDDARPLRITRVGSRGDARVGAPSTVDVSLATAGVSADSLSLELRSGATLLDRRTIAVDRQHPRLQATLAFVPPTIDAHAVTVFARAIGTPSMADSATTVITASARPWRVHFHDARASWQSTFVRRSIDADPRFNVTSHVATSRNIGTIVGDAPTRLGDLLRVDDVDLLVIGAPDALGTNDVASLDALLRKRGGSVLLLFDAPVPGATGTLTDVREWRRGQLEQPVDVIFDAISPREPATPRESTTPSRDSVERPAMQLTEWFAPVRLPEGAVAVGATSGRDTIPVLFHVPVGAGRLWVSGALDAWRFRDRTTSQFVSVWSAIVASAAADALPPIEIATSPSPVRPGEPVTITVTDRSLALDGALSNEMSIVASARLDLRESAQSVRLYPTARAGVFTGEVYAPRVPGSYLVHGRTVANGAARVDSQTIVVTDAPSVRTATPEQLRAIASASGGAVVGSDDELLAALDRLVDAPQARAPWHPMRSAWWLLPLTFLLGAEWWLRRRSGRP